VRSPGQVRDFAGERGVKEAARPRRWLALMLAETALLWLRLAAVLILLAPLLLVARLIMG